MKRECYLGNIHFYAIKFTSISFCVHYQDKVELKNITVNVYGSGMSGLVEYVSTFFLISF